MTTYRSDHEAALARIDALEQEIVDLRAGNPPTRKPWPMVAASLLGLTVGFIGGATFVVAGSPDVAHSERWVPPVDRSRLEACANQIEEPRDLGPYYSDPAHGGSTRNIERTAAPCREELRAVVELGPLTAYERAALTKWSEHEDELAGAISRVEVYYSSDPHARDNYETAEQLWSEYDIAYYSRNNALSAWRRQFSSR